MARINQVNNISYGNMGYYTKRTCSDNSELFINSKLDTLYKQALSSLNSHKSRRALRKMVEGNRLDEIV